MKNRVPPLTVSLRPNPSLPPARSKWRHVILAGAIAPAGLVLTTSATAADRVVPPSFTINSDTGAPVFAEGLREGFVDGSANTTTANPFNSSPELTLRMGQSTATGPDAWADNRTWIYTGQIFTGPNGIISIAANNDDFDWFSIDGVPVLNNNTWNVPNAAVVTGLTANTWVDFEFRVGNGGGGAGPSGQNNEGGSNWNTTTGVVMSYEDESDPVTFLPSLNALDYNLGRPTEPAGGGPTLFRYQNGLGFDDDLRVTGSGTITIDGDTPTVTEPSLRFENAADAVLTVNDGTGTHKTLGFSAGTTLASNTAPAVIAGTSDVRVGRLSDGALTGVRLVAAGPGRLIIDHVDAATVSDMNGTTLEAGAGGNLTIVGSNNRSPLVSLTTPLTISGAGGTINIGSASGGLTYNNSVAALENGTLEHTTNTPDTLGSFSQGVTVAPGKTLTVKNTSNTFTIAGGVSGASVINDSTSLVRYTGAVSLNTFTNTAGVSQLRGNTTLANVNVSAGRLEAHGNFTVTSNPTIANGATLAVLNNANGGTVPSTITVPTGTLEFVPGSLGTSTIAVNGGAISLAPQFTGLVGNYYNLSPNNNGNNQNADFLNYEAYTTFFDSVTPGVGDVLTSAANTEVLSFDPLGGDTPMFSRYGFNANNQIISRMVGKIRIPTTGLYTFSTRSDDGSVVFINGALAVDNNFYQGMTTRSGTILLNAGLHDIDIGFYEEGGGNGLEVFWSGPGIANTLLSNAVLSPDITSTFSNPIDVQGTSAINSVTSKAVVTSLTLQPGAVLNTNGPDITATTMTFNGTGTYKVNTAIGTTLTASDVASNGQAVNIEKTGPGVFAIDDLTTAVPQLPAGSSITVSEGALGVLLGGATNPLGNATVTFNGGGVVLSSKAGNQNFAIPAFTGNGSIEARQIASGVAGTPGTPIQITLTGNLNVAGSQTVTLGTDDNYVLNLGGSAAGTGTVVVNGGRVVDTSGTALQNLNVALNTKGRTADLILNTNTPVLGSLSSDSPGAGTVVMGTGAGAATLTFNGAGSGNYVGNLMTNGNTAYSIVKNGTGSQSIVAPLGGTVSTTPTAVTINSGALELSPEAIGAAPINLAGGTLKMVDNGLSLKIWSANPAASYGTTLNTLASLQTYYASLGTPAFVGNTAANDNMTITYNPGGQDTNPTFGIHEYFELDNVQAMFTGRIYVPVAGDYKFSPRSDDGSTVYINGQPISLNNFAQGINEAAQAPRDGTVTLSAGYHDILMTFNEGGGGNGLYVDITGPDGLRRRLSNTELFTTDVKANNVVNLTTSSGVDAQGGILSLGTLNWTAGATLTSVNGTAAFATTALPGAGTYSIAGTGSVQPGNITVPGGAAVTLHNTGTGSLILNNTTTPHLTNPASVVLADGGGRVVLVTDNTVGANPLGSAVLRLGGAGGSGELVISTKFPENFTVNPNLQIEGNALLTAGNAGGDAVSGAAGLPIEATISNALNYGANSLTLRSNSNYALRVGGAVTGTGALVVTGGDVTTNAAVTAGTVSVTGGRLTTASSLTASSAAVGKGGTLRLSGAANLSGGATVTQGTLEVNGTTYTGGNISLDGGYVEAVGGVNDLSAVVVNGTAKTTVANALTANLYPSFTQPRGGFATDQGMINTFSTKPAFSRTLDAQALNFGPNSAGDGAIASFFGASSANVDSFTMSFTGTFTAQETGVHSFRETMVDDSGAFWVDLNQNGFFELEGSAGPERLALQNCCGPADPNTSVGSEATLIAGQTYKVAMVVQDTGGGGSYAARFSTPSMPEAFVQPGAQSGMWATSTGGGSVRVASDSQLVLGQANNIDEAVFTGTNGVLKFNNGAARTTAVGLLRSDVDAGLNTVDLGPNDTMNATLLLVNDGSSLTKTGAGTLNAGTIGLAPGGMLEVSGGRAVVQGPGVGEGTIVANNTGIAIINGSIEGGVRADAGGTIGGVGTVGVARLEGGRLSPGDNGVGTLTTGPLEVLGGTIALDITGPGQGDKIASSSVSLTSDVAISLNLGTYNPVLQGPGNFVIIENLGLDPIAGLGDGTEVGGNSLLTFEGNRLAQAESFFVNGVEMKINYFGGTGNDVVLSAIPEPGTVGALLCGVGSLLSMRLRRRRS